MTVSETAIEAAAKRVYEDKGDRKGIAYVGWDNEPDDVKERWREDVRVSVEAYLTAALSEQVVVPGWQDIATAPKDGTGILVWPYWSDGLPAAVHWRDMKRTPGRWEITPTFFCYGAQPTHWQHLRSAPVRSW